MNELNDFLLSVASEKKSILESENNKPEKKLKKLNESFLKNLDTSADIGNIFDSIPLKHTGKPLAYYKGEGKPNDDWMAKQERRIQYFKNL